MSAPELVRLTIDGVSVEVPKGTGLVEAALAAGVENTGFCYEPPLGAPLGAASPGTSRGVVWGNHAALFFG